MKNLTTLCNLSIDEVYAILKDAKKFKGGFNFNLNGKIIANLFFEPSTRTQYSFNVAQEKLNMKVINFNPSSSSLQKGETFYDTIKTFASFGIDAIVIRSAQDKYYELLTDIKVPIINAGDGKCDHPSQTLLDLFTIWEEFGKFEGLKIAIIGDIKHSRVAHGNIEIMERLGMDCYISGSSEYTESNYKWIDFEEALKTMDIIMLLRIQHERHNEAMKLSKEEYFSRFGLTSKRVEMMKEHAIIMHPAPFNRGVEIADEVVECEKSRIFKQIENGVFIRQSIIKRCFE